MFILSLLNNMYDKLPLIMSGIYIILMLAVLYASNYNRIESSHKLKFWVKYSFIIVFLVFVCPKVIGVALEQSVFVSFSIIFVSFVIYFLLCYYTYKSIRDMINSIFISLVFLSILYIIVLYSVLINSFLTFIIACPFTIISLLGVIVSSKINRAPIGLDLNVYKPAIYKKYVDNRSKKQENNYLYFNEDIEILNFQQIDISNNQIANSEKFEKGSGVLLRIPTYGNVNVDFYVDYILKKGEKKEYWTTSFILKKDSYGVYQKVNENSHKNYVFSKVSRINRLANWYSRITFGFRPTKPINETINQYSSSMFANNIYYPGIDFETIQEQIKSESSIEKSVAYISGPFGSGKTTLAHAILRKHCGKIQNYQHDHSSYEDLLSDIANNLLGIWGFYGFLKLSAFIGLVTFSSIIISIEPIINLRDFAASINKYLGSMNYDITKNLIMNYENQLESFWIWLMLFVLALVIASIIWKFSIAIGLINFGSGIQTERITNFIAKSACKNDVKFVFDEIDRNVEFENTYLNLQQISYLKTEKSDDIIGIANFDEKMVKREQCRYNQFKFINTVNCKNDKDGVLIDEQCVTMDYQCEKCGLLSECKLQQLLKKKYIRIDVNLGNMFRKYILSTLFYSQKLFEETTGIVITMEDDKLRKLVEIILKLDEKQIHLLMMPIKFKADIDVPYFKAIAVIQQIVNCIKDEILALVSKGGVVSYHSVRGIHSIYDFDKMENLVEQLGIYRQKDKAQFIEDCGKIANGGFKNNESNQWNWLINAIDLNNDESSVYISLLEFLFNGFKGVPNSKMQSACKAENFRDLKFSLVEYFDNQVKIFEKFSQFENNIFF